MAFEWDDKKNAINRQKHGIDFSTAIAVFDDPNRLEAESTRPEHGEMRTVTIGMMGSVLVITVIHTDRGQNKRIISARLASKAERKRYMSFIN
ncbi:MAG: BrnT family toxin [Methylococcales bacterium]|nr:BrnT family toxin [Methylococcales bacterium]